MLSVRCPLLEEPHPTYEDTDRIAPIHRQGAQAHGGAGASSAKGLPGGSM